MEVKLIAYSQAPNGQKIATFALEYPQFIHAELMTHRVFSRNGQSSRAVPVNKGLSAAPLVMPLEYGRNKAGMSSSMILSSVNSFLSKVVWRAMGTVVSLGCRLLAKIGLHKQWANRPYEAFSNIKVVVTSTEWDNFFSLRLNAKTVQPEMRRLAEMMKHEMELTPVKQLLPGEWHLPYIASHWNGISQERVYRNLRGSVLTLEQAKEISVSCCAQVSYRQMDQSLMKARKIHEMLTQKHDPHMSPFEHQATPMYSPTWEYPDNLAFKSGTTHVDADGRFWSGNFCGFIQHRQLMENK